jgi:hypothetical protein
MDRRLLLMPRPGSRVVHARFEEHVRPTATGTMTAVVSITRDGGPGVFDPVTRKTAQMPDTVVYAGVARVQTMLRINQPVEFGGQQVSLHRYQVSVEWSGVVRVDDTITFTAATDPVLVGRRMRVLDVVLSSLELQRDLICEDTLG